MTTYKISLVLCTLNRDIEIEHFLVSLKNQSYKNYELIVIDQNKNNLIDNIINKYRKYILIKHIKVNFTGLSKARNEGLKYISGDIIAFPDDDCEYPSDLLKNVNIFFSQHSEYDILTGKAIDKETSKISAGKLVYACQELSPFNLLVVSFTLFIRLKNIKKGLLYFDEYFGLGAPFCSDEENDLLYRLLKSGYRGFYHPEKIFVFHPPKDFDFRNYERAYKYGIGLGAFVKKHINESEGFFYFVNYCFVRPVGGIVLGLLSFNFDKAKFYIYRLKGRWKGFKKYGKIKTKK